MDEEINKVLLLVRDVKKQVEILMSTHTTHPSSNDVPPEVEEDLAVLKSTVGHQQRILEYQQRDARKLNLIISGVKETENEDTTSVIKEIFNVKLSLDESIYPSMVKRIGKKGRNRLILVSTFCLDDKLAVLKKRTKLKGSRIYINDDLTPQQRERRKKLIIMCRNARSDGKKAFVKNGPLTLVVDGKEMDSYPPNNTNSNNSDIL